TIYNLRSTRLAGESDRGDQASPITYWTGGWATLGSPSPPALSPGERENGPLPLEYTRVGICPTTIGQTPIRRLLFPLPEGERQGEGKILGRTDKCDWINRCRATADETFRAVQLLRARAPLVCA